MGNHRNRRNNAGFSLLEVCVIVMVLCLLAGLVAPTAKNLLIDGKAQRIAELAETLRGSCMRYHMDTNAYAKEGVFDTQDSNGDYSALVTDRDQYLLSYQATTPGWKGPYIDHPLTPQDNPLGFPILVRDQINDGAAMQGFDFDGSGLKRNGPGNMLVVHLDPRPRSQSLELATKVDEIIDKSKGAANWSSKGRVNYVQASATLYIYLYQAP